MFPKIAVLFGFTTYFILIFVTIDIFPLTINFIGRTTNVVMWIVRVAEEENDLRVTMNLVSRHVKTLIFIIIDFSPIEGALMQNAIFFGMNFLAYDDAVVFFVYRHMLVLCSFGIFRQASAVVARAGEKEQSRS